MQLQLLHKRSKAHFSFSCVLGWLFQLATTYRQSQCCDMSNEIGFNIQENNQERKLKRVINKTKFIQ